MYKTDRPIKSGEEDTLGRKDFASSFANAMIAYKNKDSIVTSICGNWGSGKSSFINMVIEQIDKKSSQMNKNEKTIIIRYSPWRYSNQNHLISLFFKEVSSALSEESYGKTVKKIRRKLKKYAKNLKPLESIPEPTTKTLWFFIEMILVSIGILENKDLEIARTELDDALKKEKRKIIIVMDDVDRLNNNEIRQVFQLVKTLGDFSNIIYLLAFDRRVILKALEQVQPEYEGEYLEKIIQFPVDLPAVDNSYIENILLDLINELIEKVPEDRWNNFYWGNLYYGTLHSYFKTIRDINRFINVLKFEFELVRENVNLADFISITALKVFEPDLYSSIRENKHLFTDTFKFGYLPEKIMKEQAIKQLDEIFKRVTNSDKEELIDFIGRLFPKINKLYKGINYEPKLVNAWWPEYRICHPEIYDVYFQLVLPARVITKHEAESILDLSEDKKIFSEALQNLCKENKIEKYLDLIRIYAENQTSIQKIQNIVSVLMDVGDMFPSNIKGMSALEVSGKIMRIFHQLSFRFNTQEERFQIFYNAMSETENSICTVLMKVTILGHEHGRNSLEIYEPPKALADREVSEDHLNKLEQLAIEKITSWGKNERLCSHANLREILYLWKGFDASGPDASRVYVNKLISSDEGLIQFITAFSSLVSNHTSDDYMSTEEQKINFNSMNDFVKVGQLEPRIRKLHNSSAFSDLKEEQQKYVKIFLDTADENVANQKMIEHLKNEHLKNDKKI